MTTSSPKDKRSLPEEKNKKDINQESETDSLRLTILENNSSQGEGQMASTAVGEQSSQPRSQPVDNEAGEEKTLGEETTRPRPTGAPSPPLTTQKQQSEVNA